uniref:Solute carrier family 23 member 3 n=1 Tax=Strix occidentalis caurina TaxID=311401 RepID=A0A8D0EJS6_STROC
MLLGLWECGQGEVLGCSPCILPHGSHPFLLQVSGAVLVSGLVQLALGVSGVCGWAARRCGPMVLAPSLSIIGLSTYKEAAFFCSTNWGVALLYVSLRATLVCSPFPAGTEVGPPHGAWHMFGAPSLLPVLGQQHLPWPLGPHPLCRWGAAGLGAAIHLRPGPLSPVPSPSTTGEWGWPLLTPRVLAVGIAMAINCSMNSVGCYVLCGRLLRAPRLPPYACNRGLCTEGLGSLLAGLLGTPGGTATSIANACATGLTQVCLGWGGGRSLLPLPRCWAGPSWVTLTLSPQAGCLWTSSSSLCSWYLSS